MTENQKTKIDKLIALLPDREKKMYRNIAEYAVELGYSPAKINETYKPVVFAKMIKNYGHRGICSITPPNPMDSEAKTKFSMSFYAASEYSEIFHESVRYESESRKNVITVPDCLRNIPCKNEQCGFYKKSNGKCRKCKSYYYTYRDGKVIECDHKYLIELLPISPEHIDEIKILLKAQHECWMNHLLP